MTGADAVDAFERAASSVLAEDLEDAVVTAGGCAAAVRSRERWAEHPAGRSAATAPLVAREPAIECLVPRGLPMPASRSTPAGRSKPASGVRVLDITRVIAGPVAGRTLAALGAEVLRIDSPALPELPAQHLDTEAGKRSAFLDLADAERREALLAGADVVLTGYRDGALSRFGLRPEELAERHPHLVQVSLSAWGTEGPWAGRRGFDSIVQAACGIAVICAGEDETPGALPAQALDHATGHLIAAAALMGLARRACGHVLAPARLSLSRTAAMLLRARPPESEHSDATGKADPRRHSVGYGELTLIAPPGKLDGVPLAWEHGPRLLGSDAPLFRFRS
jgi:CoA-transferase family III